MDYLTTSQSAWKKEEQTERHLWNRMDLRILFLAASAFSLSLKIYKKERKGGRVLYNSKQLMWLIVIARCPFQGITWKYFPGSFFFRHSTEVNSNRIVFQIKGIWILQNRKNSPSNGATTNCGNFSFSLPGVRVIMP